MHYQFIEVEDITSNVEELDRHECIVYKKSDMIGDL